MALLPHGPRSPRLLAEFVNVDAMLASLDALSRESYGSLETFTPYDVPDVDRKLGLARSRIGRVAAFGGVCGLVASYGIQWWANVHAYPVNAGGRPAHAAPAFVLATFEGTIAGAAIAAFVALFILLRLPRPWSPEDEIDDFHRSTIDRFWISMASFTNERDRDRAVEIVKRNGAVRAVKVGAV